MVVNTENFIIAKEKRMSKKGNEYGIITIIDNSNSTLTVNCLVENMEMFERIPVLKKCNMILNIGLGKYRNITVNDVRIA